MVLRWSWREKEREKLGKRDEFGDEIEEEGKGVRFVLGKGKSLEEDIVEDVVIPW